MHQNIETKLINGHITPKLLLHSVNVCIIQSLPSVSMHTCNCFLLSGLGDGEVNFRPPAVFPLHNVPFKAAATSPSAMGNSNRSG